MNGPTEGMGKSAKRNRPMPRWLALALALAWLAPCPALAAIRTPAFGASAHPADAAVNNAIPATSMRRRPSRVP